jgi:hypothetical protein
MAKKPPPPKPVELPTECELWPTLPWEPTGAEYRLEIAPAPLKYTYRGMAVFFGGLLALVVCPLIFHMPGWAVKLLMAVPMTGPLYTSWMEYGVWTHSESVRIGDKRRRYEEWRDHAATCLSCKRAREFWS